MADREMVELWNGPASEAWVLRPQRYDGMLEHLGRLALDAALPPGGSSSATRRRPLSPHDARRTTSGCSPRSARLVPHVGVPQLPEQREVGLSALREAVAPRMTDEGLRLGAAVWVVTAARGG